MPPATGWTAMEYPSWSETLRDRSHLIIRPMTSGDGEARPAFMSDRATPWRSFRIAGQVRSRATQGAGRWTPVEHHHQARFVAVVPDAEADGRIVGVSCYSSDAMGLHCECTVATDESWQAKGVGILLMRHLMEVAHACGMCRMRATGSVDNAAMSDLAMALGFRTRTDPDDPHLLIHEMTL